MNQKKLFRLIFAWAVLISMLSGCEKYSLDRQMKELCEKDGGSKVYETVTLPADMFDEYGYPFPGWRKRLKGDRLSKEYLYIREEKILKDGKPSKGEGRLRRVNVRIIRKTDFKTLGETIGYFRAGGDGIVLGHHTTNACPKIGEPIEKLVFLKN